MKIRHLIPVFAMALAFALPVQAAENTAAPAAGLKAASPDQSATNPNNPPAVQKPTEGQTADEAHAPNHFAAGGDAEHVHWSFEGMFGTYDRASLQRGLKVYREVCSACHSLKRVYFRNLEALGYNDGQVKNIASQYTVNDGPNDEGEMFDRPALPSDHFVGPYPNDNAAKAANNGALPPDLSLIVKARHHGPHHIYGILTGFADPPAGTTLLPGQHWNKEMAGHIMAMPPPLQDGQVMYEDNAPQTVQQYAYDVSQFLTWAGDPYMEQRKQTGIKVIIFLAVFAGLMYAVKRKVWANLH